AVERGDRHAEDAVAAQAAVFQRVAGAAGLVQVGGGEVVLVDDEDAAGLEVLEVGLQRGGVHGDEGVEVVAGGVDIAAAEVDLEAGDAGRRPRRGADLRGEVRQGADVVAEQGRGVGELGAGQLHAVARVPRQADRHAVALLDGNAADGGAADDAIGRHTEQGL